MQKIYVGENIAWNVNFLQLLIINYVHCQKLYILSQSVVISKYKIRYEKPFCVTNLSVCLWWLVSQKCSQCAIPSPCQKKTCRMDLRAITWRFFKVCMTFRERIMSVWPTVLQNFVFYALKCTHAPWSIPQVTFSYLIYIHEHQRGFINTFSRRGTICSF